MMSFNSNWFTPLLLCTSAPLVLCRDMFNYGSSLVKCELVDLVTEDNDISLCQRILILLLLAVFMQARYFMNTLLLPDFAPCDYIIKLI